MHEVMSGSFFTPQRESVPEQTWSSSAFLSATIDGMLGLASDARTNVLHFAPQLPATWPWVRVEHVRVGKSVVDLYWHAENGRNVLDLRNAGPTFHLVWSRAAADKDGKRPARLRRDIPPGDTRLSLP